MMAVQLRPIRTKISKIIPLAPAKLTDLDDEQLLNIAQFRLRSAMDSLDDWASAVARNPEQPAGSVSQPIIQCLRHLQISRDAIQRLRETQRG